MIPWGGCGVFQKVHKLLSLSDRERYGYAYLCSQILSCCLLHIEAVGSDANGMCQLGGLGGAVLYNYATSLVGFLDDNVSVLT